MTDPGGHAAEERLARARIRRDALAVGFGTGVYAVAFGATATAAGASVAQCVVLSAVMFTGASQLALVGILGDGGTGAAAIGVAVLVGARNLLYGVRVGPLLPRRQPARLLGTHLVLDETAAMAAAQPDPERARLAYWATGLILFTCWNLGTLVGALGTGFVDDPEAYGLDVMFPAAFLALMGPQLRDRLGRQAAALAVLLTMATAWWAPRGVPVLVAALAIVVGARRQATPS